MTHLYLGGPLDGKPVEEKHLNSPGSAITYYEGLGQFHAAEEFESIHEKLKYHKYFKRVFYYHGDDLVFYVHESVSKEDLALYIQSLTNPVGGL